MAQDVTTNLTLNTRVTGSGKAASSLGNVNRGVGDLIGRIGGIAAVGAAIGSVVTEFATFEKTMSSVKAITKATGEDFKIMNDTAKELGATTAFTAKEAAEGMKFLGMAGFQTNEIIEAIPATLNLASAAAIGLGESADIMSNVLSGFQIDASETERVVDVLASTVTSSNTDMIQLGEAMKFIAPTASNMGISVEETSAAIGILGNSGLQGSIATRALATSLARLADPSDKAAGAMERSGLVAFDNQGKFVGLAGVIEQLEVGMAGMTEEQKLANLSMIFGKDALKNWSVLVNSGSEELKVFTEQLENSAGTAQEMADTQLDNLAGSFTLFKSAVSGVAIDVGEGLSPGLRELLDIFTEVIADVKDLISVFGGSSSIIVENREVIKTIIKTLALGLTAAIIGVTEAVRLSIEGWKAFFELISFGFDTMKTTVIDTIDFITEKVTAFIGLISDAIRKAKEFFGFSGRKAPDIDGARADGGPVTRGGTFLVGERGPELFTPSTSGTIIPNERLGGGSTVVHVVNHISGVINEEAAESVGDAIMQKLQDSVAI